MLLPSPSSTGCTGAAFCEGIETWGHRPTCAFIPKTTWIPIGTALFKNASFLYSPSMYTKCIERSRTKSFHSD